VQQISLSQRATKNDMEVLKKGMETKMDGLKKGVESKMDGLKNGMEAKMDGMEAGMESKMDDMEAKMENMKNDLKADMEGLPKLIQEMFSNGEKIVEETKDENKINVNRDFINSNFGGKNHHIPKMDMRKFDGKDPVTWILQMGQYFDLNNVQNIQKVRIATLHLEQNTFVWYRWLCSRKKIDTWSIFMEEMIAHYEDTKSNTFFSQLINLKQKCSG
jgi:hypothetical protein